MKQNTQNTNEYEVTDEQVITMTAQDVKHSVLIVSLVANLFVLTAWVAIESTNAFNGALITYLQK